MILTATSDSTRLVEYEWTINGVVYSETTQTIEVDVATGGIISVRAKNDCGSWSTLVYKTIEEEDDNYILVLIIVVFVLAFMLSR